MGQQYPALETNWKLWAKVPAEFRNYEEDFFFCKCSASSDPVEFSAYLATAIHQMLPARDARFCLPENWAAWVELQGHLSHRQELACMHCRIFNHPHSRSNKKPTPIFSLLSMPPMSVSAWAFFSAPSSPPSSQLHMPSIGGHFTLHLQEPYFHMLINSF